MLDKLQPIIYDEEQEWYLSIKNIVAKTLEIGIGQKKVMGGSSPLWLSLIQKPDLSIPKAFRRIMQGMKDREKKHRDCPTVKPRD